MAIRSKEITNYRFHSALLTRPRQGFCFFLTSTIYWTSRILLCYKSPMNVTDIGVNFYFTLVEYLRKLTRKKRNKLLMATLSFMLHQFHKQFKFPKGEIYKKFDISDRTCHGAVYFFSLPQCF